MGLTSPQIHKVISDEITPLFRQSGGPRFLIEFVVQKEHPAITALLGRVNRGNHILLSYDDVIEQPTGDNSLWSAYKTHNDEKEALVGVMPGNSQDTKTFGLWLDAYGKMGAPGLEKMIEQNGGKPLLAMGYYPQGPSAFGSTQAEQLAACMYMIDRLEDEYMRGHSLVVFIALDPLVAYYFGDAVQGAGRFPELKFVEFDEKFTVYDGRQPL